MSSLFDMYKKGSGQAATTGRIQTQTPNQTAPPRTERQATNQAIQGNAPLSSSYRLGKIRADVKAAHTKVDTMVGKRDMLLKQRTTAEKEKAEAEKALATFDLVQILLQKTSEFAREQIKVRVEDIVSQALNVVFGGNHRFFIQLDVRSSQPVADYYLDDGQVITKLEKPDYDRGGGKIDVISLALKLAIGELEQIPGPLYLDEVGKHVSKEYAPNVAYFLKQYSSQFDRQIILITHSRDLAEIGDVGLEVTQNDKGESIVRGVTA